MKKTLSLALLLLFLATLAVAQCVPPPVYNSNGTPAGRNANWPTNSLAGPYDPPDYFACANYASSSLPKRSCSYADPGLYPNGKACYGDIECATQIDPLNPTVVSTCSGPIVPNTGIQKFIDTLPGLGPAGANGLVTPGGDPLGQYIPVAVPDIVTYPGSDYYEIALVEYSEKMHSSLPPTKMRGYIQLNNGTNVSSCATTGCTSVDNTVAPNPYPHFLGPTILSSKNRPVRILFRNKLATGQGGNLFVPVDTTIMGAGIGPDRGGAQPVNSLSVTDEVRNPLCGLDPKPADCFTDNRATLHLHGGMNPWNSDGTPHQWITPAGERPYPDATHPENKGVSVFNVPDMPDPGPGAQTFFYTNQQSARLMFYHDHAWGITRLNVYAGEAAGYVLTDATEQALMAPGGALAGLSYGIPLVIQDRTFVPTPDQLAIEDPTWDMTRWGGLGSLWVPHVYMPAQNPGDVTGMSGFGRWMYGPWFWPPATPPYGPIANPYYTSDLTICDPDPTAQGWCQPPLIPGTPNLSVGQEAFNDTPIVNGTAYPTITLAPGEYRFRILNAANDRFWNLQWYVADATGTEVALNAAEVAAAQLDPNIVPTPDTTLSPKGPAWVQIGTEGGFLPAPVVIPNQVTTWIIDPTRFDVGNVDKHSLLVAPAERADVVVDFTPFAGKTLILYNDAPAAFPARVATYDYYTGAPDQTDAGGAPSTQPGFGPNTRTIMQVKISGSGGAATPDYVNPTRLAALQTAFAHHPDGSGVFESSLDPIIVGQGAYNSAYGTNFRFTAPRDGFARIADFSLTFNTLLTGNSSTNTLTIPFQPKGMHDEMNSVAYDEYGRMTANLGFEVPNPNPLVQNIVLYPYIQPPIRKIDGFVARDDVDPIELPPGTLQVDKIASAADGTQIWKITHNGVDTHPIHFHLFNVQLLNRVTWDNRVLQPDPNELGWKDTVRISPLEDTIVALRPVLMKVPFGLPDSLRPMNPAMPLGNPDGFSNVDPDGGAFNPPITNAIINFGWEYVWHCHILGHEEMDMMRPLIANTSRALPAASDPVTFTRVGPVILTWTDGTPTDYTNAASWGNPASEIGFRILRADVPNGNAVPPDFAPGPYTQIGSALANQITFTDATTDPTLWYSYIIVAYNAAGDSPSTAVLVPPATNTFSTTTTIGTNSPITYGQNGLVTVTVTAGGGAPASGLVTLTVNGGAPLTASLDAAGMANFTLTKPAVSGSPYALVANFAAQGSLLASSGTGTLVVIPAALTLTANSSSIVYGTPLPTFTVTGTGFAPGDTLASLTGTLSCVTTPAAAAVPAVGTYTINCSGLASPNYTITPVAGTLTVTPRAASVTPNPAGKEYGSLDPGLTGTLTGFLAADGVTATYTRAAGETVAGSPYVISATLNPVPVLANYTITYNTALFTITPKAASVTPNAATKVWGQADPVLTGALVGFMPADGVTATYTRTAGTAVGNYTISATLAPAGVLGNYAITYNTAPFTITTAIQLTPPSLTFAAQNIGSTSPAQTVTLRNIGGATLTTISVTFTGLNPGDFVRNGGGGTCGTTLAAGATCTINVRFRPTATGVRTANLSVTSAGFNSGTVALTGTGNGAVAAVSPASHNFGGVTRGTQSAPFSFTVTNSGNTPLTFNAGNGFTLGGNNPGQFTLAATAAPCVNGGTLAAGTSCSFSVTFAPTAGTARNTKNATVTVRSNATNGNQSVTVSGTAQ